MQPLNLMDQVMASLHRALRRQGYAGLLLQSHLRLAGRVDEAALRAALERLGRVHPVAAGRLVGPSFGREPRWEWSEPAACSLTVATLDSNEDTAVVQYAESLMAAPADLADVPPVCFHLLRRPGGRDAVVVQWSHVLMDGHAGELLLREVNRLHADPAASAAPLPPGDLLRQQVRNHPWRRRLQAAWKVIRDLPIRGVPARLETSGLAGPTTPRILLRFLDDEQSAQCRDRVRRLCGFGGVTPALLAAGFRAAALVAPQRPGPRSVFYTHVPVTNRPPTGPPVIFANLQSYVRVRARPRGDGGSG